MSRGLGKVECLVLLGISKAVEYIKDGVYHPEVNDRMFDLNKWSIESGRAVPTKYLWWWLADHKICKSSLSRALKTLAKRELIYASGWDDHDIGDRFYCPKYYKYFSLTDEGEAILSVNILKMKRLALNEVTL